MLPLVKFRTSVVFDMSQYSVSGDTASYKLTATSEVESILSMSRELVEDTFIFRHIDNILATSSKNAIERTLNQFQC